MWEILAKLTDPRVLVVLLIALAAFAAVLSIASTLTERDPLQGRMKMVSEERERLRVRQKIQAAGEVRLREKRKVDTADYLVNLLQLRRIFEAEASRQLLRQAGLRSERHLILYLAARCAVPIVAALGVFFYVSTLFADSLTPSARFAVSGIAMVIGNYLPYLYVKNKVNRRQDSIRRAWPDALDLMLICVEAGMAVEPAMQRVSREIGAVSVALAEELGLTVAELSYLQDRRKALENLSKRTGLNEVKSVVTSLIQSERYGTPLGTALRVLAQENRDMRMAEVERKAAGLPPKLTVPMMIFFMPVIFIIIMGPAVMSGLKMLQ